MNKFPIIALVLVLIIGSAISFAGGYKPDFSGWRDFRATEPATQVLENAVSLGQWNQAVAMKEVAQAHYRRAAAEERIAAALERMAAAMEQ
ncbi:MAG: hypothetical protein ACE5HR_03020 [bacterium]